MGVVGKDRIYTNQDGIRAGPHLVDHAHGMVVGDLGAFASLAGDLAVGGFGPFHGHIRSCAKSALEEGGIELLALGFQKWADHFDAGFAKSLNSASIDIGIGIKRTDDDAFEAGLDQKRGAGWGLFIGVAAGFEIEIGRGAAGVFGAGFQGSGFGMGAAEMGVMSLTDDASIPDDDAADHGIGLDTSAAKHRQTHGMTKEVDITVICVHPRWFAGVAAARREAGAVNCTRSSEKHLHKGGNPPH